MYEHGKLGISVNTSPIMALVICKSILDDEVLRNEWKISLKQKCYVKDLENGAIPSRKCSIKLLKIPHNISFPHL